MMENERAIVFFENALENCVMVAREPFEMALAALRRTAEDDKAQSEGLLVELPCKDGDKIYNTASFFSALKEPAEYIVEGFTFWRGEITILCKGGYRTFGNKIGKTVFLTRAEAEAALEAQNG